MMISLQTSPTWPKGAHGYDPSLRSMHTVMWTSGPAFRHCAVDEHRTIHQVDIYNLLAHVLHIEAAPNSGEWERVAWLLSNESTRMPSIAKHSNAKIRDSSAHLRACSLTCWYCWNVVIVVSISIISSFILIALVGILLAIRRMRAKKAPSNNRASHLRIQHEHL